jgi:hypothetical protein
MSKNTNTIYDHGFAVSGIGIQNPELPERRKVDLCKQWLEKFARRSHVEKSKCIYSYSLKHIIEKHTGEYISNGACIKAAIELGFDYWQEERNINANFYMALQLPDNDEQKRNAVKIENKISLAQGLNINKSLWDDGITSDLKCPGCEHPHQHLLKPAFIDGNDSYEAHWGGKGDLVIVPIESECGSKWEICFGFHKGTTSLFIQLISSCKPKSYVYFIEAVGLDKIKIGVSDNPEKRLQQLATGSAVSLKLKAKMLGDALTESEMHRKFDHLRVDREWFYATKELRDFMQPFLI